jgi:hypothetical protein
MSGKSPKRSKPNRAGGDKPCPSTQSNYKDVRTKSFHLCLTADFDSQVLIAPSSTYVPALCTPSSDHSSLTRPAFVIIAKTLQGFRCLVCYCILLT